MLDATATGWIRSRRSGGNGNCVEARLTRLGPQIRDSKLGRQSPILTLDETTYTALIESVKSEPTDCNEQ
jgi:hypothetical protein